MLRGGSIQAVEVSEGDPDLFDAAGTLGEAFIAQQVLAYLETKQRVSAGKKAAKALKLSKVAVNGDAVTYAPLDEAA